LEITVDRVDGEPDFPATRGRHGLCARKPKELCGSGRASDRGSNMMEIQECKECGVTALGNKVDDMKDFGN